TRHAASGLLLALVVELGAQQRAETRRAGVLALVGLREPLHRLLAVGVVLGLARELDLGAARVDREDLAGHRRAAIVDGDEARERIAVELLDAERDALAVDV